MKTSHGAGRHAASSPTGAAPGEQHDCGGRDLHRRVAGTGMGHVLMANAMALRFVSLIEPARAVRFTPCLPHVTKAVIDAQIKNNKARGGFDQIPRCNEPHFDVHRHLTFAGLPLHADARDLRRPGPPRSSSGRPAKR